MNPHEIRRALREQIAEIPLFDTHEHLQGDLGDRLADQLMPMNLPDLLATAYLPAYWSLAGLRDTSLVASPKRSEQERWIALAPHLDRTAHCAAHLAYMRAFRDLYEFHDPAITESNWKRLSDRIAVKYAHTTRIAWLEHVLNWARIQRFIGNVTMPYFTQTLPARTEGVLAFERKFFLPSPRVDAFLMGCFKESSPTTKGHSANEAVRNLLYVTRDGLKAVYRTFDDYLAFVDKAFDLYRKSNIVAIKVTIAYWRTLDIQCVEEPEARRIFDTPDEFITPEVERRFQDFMMAHLARKAGDQGWPFHIHTGWGNPDLALGNPALLCNFIRRPDLRKTRFVLFHGWPFVSEFIAVAKNFPQVSLDMVWLPFHSLKASEQFLAEMLDAIPCNKVTCGGDVISAEQCYGTAELLRDLMAKVLAERVADGYLTDRAALRIAHTLLHENAESLYTP